MKTSLIKQISPVSVPLIALLFVSALQGQAVHSDARIEVMRERLEDNISVALASARKFHALEEWDLASSNLDLAFESLATLSLDSILKGEQVYIIERLLELGNQGMSHGELTQLIEDIYKKSTNGYDFSAESRNDFEASRELSVALDFLRYVRMESDTPVLEDELEIAMELAQHLSQSENEFYATLGESVVDSLRTFDSLRLVSTEPEAPVSQPAATEYLDLNDLYKKLVRPDHNDFEFDPNNRYVKSHIRLLLTKRWKELSRWLSLVTYYIPEQRIIFEEQKLPKDLVFLSVIESGLNPRAYSRKAAKGMWQFIHSTGKLYGLQRTYWKEERYNPVLAGQAAARHLKDLYDEFQDWELAIAAYNSGAGRVHSAIRRARSRNFWALLRYLPRETRDYVPLFYASLSIMKKPQQHGIKSIEHLSPIEYDEVELSGPTDLGILAQCASTDVKELRHLNPSLLKSATPPEKHFKFRIPKGMVPQFGAKYAALDPSQKQAQYATHKVKRGETLFEIAVAYGVTYQQLATLNDMRGELTIYPGQILKVPTDQSLASLDTRPHDLPTESEDFKRIIYTVESGDTLSEIAEYKFKTRASRLRRWNGLNYYDRIYPGQKLVVWVQK